MASLPSREPSVRLAELVASLSLATDLATGQVLEHGLRRALLAVWLGEELALSSEELSDIYYVALLGTVGCALETAAFARYVEDEIAVGERMVTVDPTRSVAVAAFFLKEAGAGDRLLRRARKVAAVAFAGPAESSRVCRDVAAHVGEMLRMGPTIQAAMGQCHEQWNGKGPRRLKGEEIGMATRLYQLARDAEIFNRIGGIDSAISVTRRRSGRQYDPEIADVFIRVAPRLLPRLESESIWNAILAAEPAPVRRLSPDQFDAMARAIADFVDSRSTYTLGHSHGVAALAEQAAHTLGLPDEDVAMVRRAALLHDLGRAGVPVAVWEKAGALSRPEWERVKKHPALTELVLARSDALGHLGTLGGLHHERLDGSGYRSLTGSFLPVAARILAAADTYQSKIELRPHREALAPEAAADAVRREGAAGRLDPDAVNAVLEAAGQPATRAPRPWPAELTDREIEVLCLAVRGLSNRGIAERLVVSPKTVGHHIEHIYQKIGVSTRVGATLFALQHGLVEAAS